jgi:hypothetical protein
MFLPPQGHSAHAFPLFSDFDGRNPRRLQQCAASSSIVLKTTPADQSGASDRPHQSILKNGPLALSLNARSGRLAA